MNMPVLPKTREALLPYVAHAVDDAARYYGPAHALDKAFLLQQGARFVGWSCGFEPMVVAVFSVMPGVTLDEYVAADLAIDLLRELKWFADPDNTEPDFVL